MNILKRGLVIELMEDFQVGPWIDKFPKGTVISVNSYNVSYCAMTVEKFPEGVEQISDYKEKYTFSSYTTEVEEAIKEGKIKIVEYRCAHCGQVIDGSISDKYSYVCKDCTKIYVQTCDSCGETNYGFPVKYAKADGKTLCRSCASGQTYFCATCGEIHLISNGYYSQKGDSYRKWCNETCFENFSLDNTEILSYDDKPDPVFYGEEDELHFGVELECDDGDDVDECVYDLSSISGKHICKYDGSLNDGLELVTQPMTLKYHMYKYPWYDISQTILDYGFRSDQASTCGMHIHVDKCYFEDSQRAAVELSYIINKFISQLINFSRRFDSQMSWCKVMHVDEDSLRNYRDTYVDMDVERYRAINVQNSYTIEFRLWKGTLNVKTIMATLQMTQVLCDIVKENSGNIEYFKNLTWKDICKAGNKYEELNDYLRRRNLISDTQEEAIA